MLGLSPLFLLFLTLAVLMALNGVRALVKGTGTASPGKTASVNSVATGVVSLLAAVGLVVAGYYMFQF
jgi:hypothetical protein